MIKKWKYSLLVLGISPVILLGVIVIRTLTFSSKQPAVSKKIT